MQDLAVHNTGLISARYLLPSLSVFGRQVRSRLTEKLYWIGIAMPSGYSLVDGESFGETLGDNDFM